MYSWDSGDYFPLVSGSSANLVVNWIHPLFYIRFAALRSVSLRLQSLNQKTLTEYHGFITESFHGFVFWFSFWFCFWFLFWFWLYLAGQWRFKTDFASAWALAFIRTKYWMISFSAAASGNACKSVWNLFASKGKVKKNPWSKTPCASVISVSFFDLRSVAAGSQDELLYDLSIFIF